MDVDWSWFIAWKRSVSTRSSLTKPLLLFLLNFRSQFIQYSFGMLLAYRSDQKGWGKFMHVLQRYCREGEESSSDKNYILKSNRVSVSETITTAAAASAHNNDILSICCRVTDRQKNLHSAWSITRPLRSLIRTSGPACVCASVPAVARQSVSQFADRDSAVIWSESD